MVYWFSRWWNIQNTFYNVIGISVGEWCNGYLRGKMVISMVIFVVRWLSPWSLLIESVNFIMTYGYLDLRIVIYTTKIQKVKIVPFY